MEFVTQSHLLVEANIIDMGGGDSIFLDALLKKGYKNSWPLDISEKAIERSKQRLGVAAGKVNWLLLFNEAAD